MKKSDIVKAKLAASDLSEASRPSIAADMGVSDSTLGRWLDREGTSWQSLLDDERKRRCEAVLHFNKRACMYRMMSHCGLGRQRMSACIKRWFGRTLTEIRNEMITP